jgi:hypothetical protein
VINNYAQSQWLFWVAPPSTGTFFKKQSAVTNASKKRDIAMIYTVYWFENTARQSVFFNSLSHATFFVQRLKRKNNCYEIILEENTTIAA